MSPQPLYSVLLLTWALCAADRAWGLICHVCIPQHQTGVETVTEACLTAETEPNSMDSSRLLYCTWCHRQQGKRGRFAIEEEVWMWPCGNKRAREREGGWERYGENMCTVSGENKWKETDPRTEKWRSLLGSYYCNAAQCQKRSCVCCRFISFRRH